MKLIYDWYYETTPPGKVKKILFARTLKPIYPKNNIIPASTPLKQVYFERCFVSPAIYADIQEHDGVVFYSDTLMRMLAIT